MPRIQCPFFVHSLFQEERDDRGDLMFRGPRLRMGLCHGCPRAIVPDHMGRADYHGHRQVFGCDLNLQHPPSVQQDVFL